MNKATLHIVIADDDEDDHFLFSQALKEIGLDATLLQAKTGVDVLEILQRARVLPLIIFLDVNMPIMDGLTALSNIRANNIYNNIPIIIFSTTENPIAIRDAYRLGANLYLRKPNHYNDYLNILRALILGESDPDILKGFVCR